MELISRVDLGSDVKEISAANVGRGDPKIEFGEVLAGKAMAATARVSEGRKDSESLSNKHKMPWSAKKSGESSIVWVCQSEQKRGGVSRLLRDRLARW